MPNEQFEVGDVVEWNHADSDLMSRVKENCYDMGPFIVQRLGNDQAVVVHLSGKTLYCDTPKRKRTEYNILFANLQKNIFLTAARKAVQNAR